MRTLDEIKQIIKCPEIKTDARLFHDVMGEMLNRLKFWVQHNWFTAILADSCPESKEANTLTALLNTVKNQNIADYSFSQKYFRNDEYVTIVTHHESITDLKNRVMQVHTISSNSLLFPDKEIKSLGEVISANPKADYDALFNQEFKDGFIAAGGLDTHFYTPEMLYELIVQKES